MGWFNELFASFGLTRSDQERSAQRLGDRVGHSQAERIEQGTRLRGQAEDVLNELAAGGAAPVWRLGTRRGEGSDIEEFMSGVASNAELNKLMQLISAGEGNVSTANQALGLAHQQGAQRREDQKEFFNQLMTMFMQLGGSGK